MATMMVADNEDNEVNGDGPTGEGPTGDGATGNGATGDDATTMTMAMGDDDDDDNDCDIRRSAKEPTKCIVLSVKKSTTTQRTAVKSKWREYQMRSTLIWALKLVKNRSKTRRRLFDVKRIMY